MPRLYGLAISAKRYVLFNVGADGKPIIRKASGHGLGHILAPYIDSEAPRFIPKPLPDIGVGRFQHDVWYQIVVAALGSEPDRIRLDRLPNLNTPVTVRYNATQPSILNHFEVYNRGKVYEVQVKPFNFLLRLQPTDEFKHLQPVAPYDKSTARAWRKAFDRSTGERITRHKLKTVLEALRQFHRNPEPKFENGGREDRGLTVRRHVRIIAIEHIGKEADKYEDGLFSGNFEDAVNYGSDPEARAKFMQTLALASDEFGLTALARASKVSRKEIGRIIRKAAEPRLETRSALIRALATLIEANRLDGEAQAVAHDRLRRLVALKGLSAVARQLGENRSNLSAVLTSRRRMPKRLELIILEVSNSPIDD